MKLSPQSQTSPVQYFDRACQNLSVFNHSGGFLRALILLSALPVLVGLAPSAVAAPPELDSAKGEIGQEAQETIGAITLVLGKAHLESADGSRVAVAEGLKLKVGDQITTQSNSTVHVRFVDDATVAVRKDSQLQILSYHYDRARPEASQVKFNLLRGETRAISGDAAKSARDQFRLNTPIAAIGVRGTDFVVNATESSTRALVNEGIIVMAPLSAECSFDGFGPCIANSVELSGDNTQIAQLDQSDMNPRLMPAAQDRGSEVLQQEVRSLIASTGTTSNRSESADEFGQEVFLEESTSTRVVANATTEAPITQPPITEVPGPTTPTTPEPAPPLLGFTPDVPAAAEALTSDQLVWGRYAAGFGDLERITLPLAEARVGRTVSVGNFDYGLFRFEDEKQRLVAGLGVVGFDLRSAQAYYTNASGVSPLAVLGGNLEIDFQLNRFATELNLNHSQHGVIDFSAAGSVFAGGYFHSRDDSQRIAGAVSLDGTEAGYFFEQQLEGASIQGLTLWDSP